MGPAAASSRQPRHKPLCWVVKVGKIGLEPAMRSILIAATALLLSGSAVAEPANPTQLAETVAYLLGNAHRCGVADGASRCPRLGGPVGRCSGPPLQALALFIR
jgi:hypothetical protein